VRAGWFGLIGRTKLAQAAVQGGSQIAAALVLPGGAGLMAGYAVGQFPGVATLLRRSPLRWRLLRPRRWPTLALEYRDFAVFSTVAALVNTAGNQLPTVLFARYFSTDAAGNFAFSIRLLALPTVLVGQAVAQVFYRRAALVVDDRDASKRLVEGLATSLLCLSCVVFGLVALNGRLLFETVFGPRWSEAGHYSQVLAPWFVFSMISSPVSGYAMVRQRQRQAMWMTVYETLLRLGAILFAARYAAPRLAVALYSLAGVVISIVYIGWMLRLAGSGLLRWLRRIWQVPVLFGAVLLALTGLSTVAAPFVTFLASVPLLLASGFWLWRRGIVQLDAL
jgi:O-antigen/teichoic acid export membrane protein